MTTDVRPSRRGFLGRVGAWLGGLAVLPALGVGRTAMAGRTTRWRRLYGRGYGYGYGYGVPRYGYGVPYGYGRSRRRWTTHRRSYGGWGAYRPIAPPVYGYPGGFGYPGYGGAGIQIRVGPGFGPGRYSGGYFPMLKRGNGLASPLDLLEA